MKFSTRHKPRLLHRPPPGYGTTQGVAVLPHLPTEKGYGWMYWHQGSSVLSPPWLGLVSSLLKERTKLSSLALSTEAWKTSCRRTAIPYRSSLLCSSFCKGLKPSPNLTFVIVIILFGSKKGMSGRWHSTLLVTIEYLLMPFSLTNAPTIFQSLITDILCNMLNILQFRWHSFFPPVWGETYGAHVAGTSTVASTSIICESEKVCFTRPQWLFWGSSSHWGRSR